MGGEIVACATEALHKSEGGVRQLHAGAGASAYAREISRYISCPSTVRARTMEQFGSAPPLDRIKQMRALHVAQRETYRHISEGIGVDDRDAEHFRVRPLLWRRMRPATHVAPLLPPPQGTEPPKLVPEIIAGIAEAFGLTASDVTGPCRKRGFVLARQTCMYVLWRRGSSYNRAGEWLGRDHSSVIHGCRRFEVDATPAMWEIAERFIGGAA